MGAPGEKRREYAITWTTERGRKWLRRHFKGGGMIHYLGRRRLADAVGVALMADGLSYRVVEF
jgi:hypothetical protein